MINSNDIQLILEDSSFQEAMTELTKLNMDIIANSDVEDKEIREVAYMKVKVINEILGHLESLGSNDKIKSKRWKI